MTATLHCFLFFLPFFIFSNSKHEDQRQNATWNGVVVSPILIFNINKNTFVLYQLERYFKPLSLKRSIVFILQMKFNLVKADGENFVNGDFSIYVYNKIVSDKFR